MKSLSLTKTELGQVRGLFHENPGILSKALVGLADDPQIQKMYLRRKHNRYLDEDLRNARTEFTFSQPAAPIAQQPKNYCKQVKHMTVNLWFDLWKKMQIVTFKF